MCLPENKNVAADMTAVTPQTLCIALWVCDVDVGLPLDVKKTGNEAKL